MHMFMHSSTISSSSISGQHILDRLNTLTYFNGRVFGAELRRTATAAMIKLLSFSLIIAALAAPPTVHLELLRPNLVVDGVHREHGLVAYQVSVEEHQDWTDNMIVCYWALLTESLYHLPAEAVVSISHCVETPSGMIAVASFKCGQLLLQ
jgi:hypothetical protein